MIILPNINNVKIHQSMDQLSELEKLDYYLCVSVLAAIAEIPRNFGKDKSIAFLQGSKSDFIVKHKLNESPYYGCFSIFPKEVIETIIDLLIKEQLIQVEEVGQYNRPIITISSLGIKVLEDGKELCLESGIFTKKELQINDYILYDKLKELRINLANKENLPAYCICMNRSIISMANSKPTTEDELRKIKGIGPIFIKKYSDVFLKLINNYNTQVITQ